MEKGSTGIGFFSLLGIVFIILRLTGIIAWSWVWVLAPLWIPLALFVAGVFIVLLIRSKGSERNG